jgi:hypothetical protein
MGQVCMLSDVASAAAAGNAQEPIGSSSACSAGNTDRVMCYVDNQGYLADVHLSNTLRTTPVSLCGTPEWQLQDTQLQIIQISASDSFLRFRACTDSGGLRGLVFKTALDAELSCGTVTSSCRVFSSRSTYPLRGLSGTCQSMGSLRAQPHKQQQQQRPHHQQQQQQQRRWGPGVTRVTNITAACWTPQRSASQSGVTVAHSCLRMLQYSVSCGCRGSVDPGSVCCTTRSTVTKLTGSTVSCTAGPHVLCIKLRS